jgi:hypothetical protein
VTARFEYKFVRLGEGWFAARKEKDRYQEVTQEHAKDGWRLVQVFAPSIGSSGQTKFYELIFERPVR